MDDLRHPPFDASSTPKPALEDSPSKDLGFLRDGKELEAICNGDGGALEPVDPVKKASVWSMATGNLEPYEGWTSGHTASFRLDANG